MTLVVFGIPIHFCQHEAMMVMAFLGMIPFVGYWLRARFAKKVGVKPEVKHEGCDEHHHGGAR